MWKKSDSEQSFETSQGPVTSSSTSTSANTGAAANTRSRELGTIGPSISIRGEVTGDEDLVILGHIEGTITLPNHDVTLGKDARVKADVNGKKVTVEGHVEGNVSGKELVTIRRSGTVQGNISAQRVVLEDGCRFSGSVDMGGAGATDSPTKSSPRPSVADIKSRETAAS